MLSIQLLNMCVITVTTVLPNKQLLHILVTVPNSDTLSFKNFYFGIVFTQNIDNLQEGTMGS
jgi:hypothetical protein